MANIAASGSDGILHPTDFNYADYQWSDIMRYRFRRKHPILSIFGKAVGNMKDDDHYWAISPVSTFATYVASAATASTTLVVADGSLLHKGDTIDIQTAASTWVGRRVESVSTNTLTLDAAVTVAAGYRVVLLGKKGIYGVKSSNTPVEEVTDAYNAIQEFQLKVDIAKVTSTKKQRYGRNNKQTVADNLLRRMAMQFARQIYFGRRVQATNAIAAEMGGLKYFIDNYSGAAWNVGGNLKWTEIVDAIVARMNVGGFSGSDNYIFCNPTFYGYLEKLRKLSNTSIDLWKISSSGPTEIGIVGKVFKVVVDPTLIEYAKTGTTRTNTGIAFFLSGSDAEGNKNFTMRYDNPEQDDFLEMYTFQDRRNAMDMYLDAALTLEIGEPQMQMYVYGATGAAADA